MSQSFEGGILTDSKKPLSDLILQEKKIFQPQKLKAPKVILLAGPTACGKTNLSFMLAQALNGEIISADSMQVYKGMDIGTAKVNKEDQEKIPHHLIDIRHIQESFNVVDFYYEAKKCCEAILARNRVPIIVGGTGFYFHALIHGPPQGPPSLSHIRQQLEEEMETIGESAMYERLKNFDPQYAETITHRDRHKIVRGLEIIMLTGEKVSHFTWKKDKSDDTDYKFCAWFLHRPRDVLYERIEKRCELMLDLGLIDEVKNLENQGLMKNSSASHAIGYRQVLKYLHGPQTQNDYKNMVEEFKKASRHYAKRQFTWFRKEKLFRWLNIEIHDFEIAADVIIQDYQSIL